MYLKERDILIFKTLEKMRFLDSVLITELCGFSDRHRCLNRLAVLCKNGYLKYEQQTITTRRYFLLTGKGMNVIYPPEKRVNKQGKEFNSYRKIPRFSTTKINHEITVANVLCHVLKCNPQLSIDDFQTDRDLQKISVDEKRYLRHCCDLFCEKYRIKIEVELSLKKKSLEAENISFNGDDYVQVWITGNNQIYNQLNRLKEENPYFFMNIVKLEDLEQTPINFQALYEQLLEYNPLVSEQLTIDDMEI